MFACQSVWARGKWCKPEKVLNSDCNNTLCTSACSWFSVLLLGALSLPHPSMYAFTLLHFSAHFLWLMFQPTDHFSIFSPGLPEEIRPTTQSDSCWAFHCVIKVSLFFICKMEKRFLTLPGRCKFLGIWRCYQEHSNYSRNTRTFPLFSWEVLNSLWSVPYYWGRAPTETRAEQ